MGDLPDRLNAVLRTPKVDPFKFSWLEEFLIRDWRL